MLRLFIRVRRRLLVAGCLTAVAVPAAASAAETPRFVGTPSVDYRGSSIAAVVRFDRAIPKGIDGAALVASPRVRAGDAVDPRDVEGAEPAGSIGIASRHCYLVGPGRVDGAPTLRDGARWRLGLLLPKSERIASSARVTLRRSRDESQLQAAKRLGCTSSSNTRARDRDLIGRSVAVTADNVQVYAKAPGTGSYAGTLMRGERFRTVRTSASGKYAYGQAYGNVNRRTYVATNALR